MKVCIHRGAKELGGICIEVESDGKRILLDIGSPLDCPTDEVLVPDIPGLKNLDETLLGIIISHAHLDHFGLLNYVNQSIPVYIGDGAKKVINASRLFFPDNTAEIQESNRLNDRSTLEIGPFKITSFLVDHSAYDAYAIMVEAGGKRLFYTGDFRAHGRKKNLLDRLIADPPANVDVLLMEGTTLSSSSDEVNYPTEDILERCFIKHIENTKGMVLVWTAAQNIDRLVTIYKACRQTRRMFITDLYTASILRAIDNPKLPQPGWKMFRVFVPKMQKQIIKREGLFDLAKSVSDYRVYPEKIRKIADRAVMLFRPSMVRDFEDAGCLDGASLIYSMWPGYLAVERLAWFRGWLEGKNIPMNHCHTSGHAPVKDLMRLSEAVNPKRLIPIHSFEPGLYPEYFDNVEIKGDGKWWIV